MNHLPLTTFNRNHCKTKTNVDNLTDRQSHMITKSTFCEVFLCRIWKLYNKKYWSYRFTTVVFTDKFGVNGYSGCLLLLCTWFTFGKSRSPYFLCTIFFFWIFLFVKFKILNSKQIWNVWKLFLTNIGMFVHVIQVKQPKCIVFAENI